MKIQFKMKIIQLNRHLVELNQLLTNTSASRSETRQRSHAEKLPWVRNT